MHIDSIREPIGRCGDQTFQIMSGQNGRLKQDKVVKDLEACKIFLEKMCEFSRVTKFNILICKRVD